MQLKLTARHDTLSDATREYAEAKLSKLDRRLHDLALVEVTFSREHNPSIANDHSVEAIVHAKGPNIVARESAQTYEAAIDRLLDKLERQVERSRDKRTVEARRRSHGGQHPAPAGEPLEFVPGTPGPPVEASD
jgi:putative sigma-54 modulation protein